MFATSAILESVAILFLHHLTSSLSYVCYVHFKCIGTEDGTFEVLKVENIYLLGHILITKYKIHNKHYLDITVPYQIVENILYLFQGFFSRTL